MSTTHHLKTWPTFFFAVERGDKNFEVRKNDRCFQAGDTLVLQYFDPERPLEAPHPFGSVPAPIERIITYVLPGGEFGLEPGYCVLGLTPSQTERNEG